MRRHRVGAAWPQPLRHLGRPVDGDDAGDAQRVVDRRAMQRDVRRRHRHAAHLVGLLREEQRSHVVLGRVAPHVPGQLGGLRRVVAVGRGGRPRCAARDVRHAGQWHIQATERAASSEWPFRCLHASEFPPSRACWDGASAPVQRLLPRGCAGLPRGPSAAKHGPSTRAQATGQAKASSGRICSRRPSASPRPE